MTKEYALSSFSLIGHLLEDAVLVPAIYSILLQIILATSIGKDW